MKRRSFLGLSLTAVAGLVLDPEKALWVPGKKLISIPKIVPANPTGIIGINIITGQLVTWEMVERVIRKPFSFPSNNDVYIEVQLKGMAKVTLMTRGWYKGKLTV